MTAQFGDRIKIDGKWQILWELPLEKLFKTVANPPKFVPTSSANWRGYIAAWEILDNELYLVGFDGTPDTTRAPDMHPALPFTLDDLIAAEKRPLFADWYSGTLRIPKGEVLEYVHMGFLSTREFDHFVEIQCGRIIRQWEIDNRTAHALRQARKADEAKRKASSKVEWLRSLFIRTGR
jgi:hypothetical protein